MRRGEWIVAVGDFRVYASRSGADLHAQEVNKSTQPRG